MFWLIVFIILVLILYIILGINEIKGKLLKINRRIKRKGDLNISKVIKSLVGNRCKISDNSGMGGSYECLVLQADEEWIKIKRFYNQESEIVVKRIDEINDIVIIDNIESDNTEI